MCERSPGAESKQHQRFDLIIGEASETSAYGTWLAAVARVAAAAAVLAEEGALPPKAVPDSEAAWVLEEEDGVPLGRPSAEEARAGTLATGSAESWVASAAAEAETAVARLARQTAEPHHWAACARSAAGVA